MKNGIYPRKYSTNKLVDSSLMSKIRGFHPRLHYSYRYAVRSARGDIATKYGSRG